MTPRRIRFPLLACAAVAAAILSGCGGGGGGSVDVGPAAAVPANAPIYIDATVRPTGTAAADAKAAAGKILNTSDPGGKIISLIQKQTKAGGHPINYQQDVAPWLGKDAGLFATGFSTNTQATVILETTDPNAALAFGRKASGATPTNPAPQTYNGVSYQPDPTTRGRVFGIVGNFLVEGDLAGFRAAVDASKGDSLGDSSDFKNAIGDLPSDRLGTFYTIPKTLLDSLGPGQIDPGSKSVIENTAKDSLDKPVAGALTASADSLNLEFTGGSSGVETPESSLLGSVPSQAWLAVGIGNLGDNLKRALDQLKAANPSIDAVLSQVQSTSGATIDQLTGALGDAAVYVKGTTQSTLSGALVVETKDAALTGRLLGQLQSLLSLSARGGVKPLSLSGGGTGFQINSRSVAPRPVEIAQQGSKIVIAYGANSAEQTLAPAQSLDGSATFSAAKGQVSSLGTDLFVSFPAIFKLAESTGAKKDPGYVQAKPYLDALNYLVSGSGTKGDQTEVKAVLGLK